MYFGSKQYVCFQFSKYLTMNYLIKAPVKLDTKVQLPASKSISNRVLLLKALSADSIEIHNLADCDDTKVMINALRTNQPEIDIKAAGTAMRFLTAYLAGKQGYWTITGTERMRNRPVKILVEALNTLGAHIEYADSEGFPPLKINGCTLQGGEVWLDGSVSSQYISALLMVAPLMEHGLQLHLTGRIISHPYIQMTIELMNNFGVIVSKKKQTYTVRPQSYKPVPFTVEADWSAASYWYEMVALSNEAEVTLQGLFENSLQGDAHIKSLFKPLGVETRFTSDGVVLRRTARNINIPFMYDFTDIPDMAQTLAVTCAMLDIPFYFSGLQSLKIKETDRLTALRIALLKLGFVVTEQESQILQWNGERTDRAVTPIIQTCEDHRMAMAFAPVAIRDAAGISIAGSEVVSKSYPHFWDDLLNAGFQISDLDKFIF